MFRHPFLIWRSRLNQLGRVDDDTGAGVRANTEARSSVGNGHSSLLLLCTTLRRCAPPPPPPARRVCLRTASSRHHVPQHPGARQVGARGADRPRWLAARVRGGALLDAHVQRLPVD